MELERDELVVEGGRWIESGGRCEGGARREGVGWARRAGLGEVRWEGAEGVGVGRGVKVGAEGLGGREGEGRPSQARSSGCDGDRRRSDRGQLDGSESFRIER